LQTIKPPFNYKNISKTSSTHITSSSTTFELVVTRVDAKDYT
jgi:hypothetical protein